MNTSLSAAPNVPHTSSTRARRLMRRGDFESRIDSICDRFSRTTGWQLMLHPVGTTVASAVADELRMDRSCRWFTAIGYEGRVANFLRLDQRRSAEPHVEFVRARELAMIVAEFIGQTYMTFDEVEDRTRDVMTILELHRAIPQTDNTAEALQQVLQAAVNLTGCFSAAFFLLSPDTDRLFLRQYCGGSLGEMPKTCRELRHAPPDLKALQTGFRTVRRERNGLLNDWLPELANIGVCCRVQSNSGPIGTLWVYDRRSFIPGEIEFQVLESLSNQAATLLERTVLQHESGEHSRLQREMTLASETQDVTPSVSPTVSTFQSGGIEIAHLSCACDTVGGDLLEVIPVGDQVVFAVGDATGHSIPAAMIMSTIRGSLRTLLTNELCDLHRPDKIMQQINSSYSQYAATGFYMSLFLGVIDPRKKILRFTNAGHPSPLIVSGGECRKQQYHGLLLGIDAGVDYSMTNVSMRRGDLLVAYTDGITEATNAEGQMFNCDGLVDAIGAGQTKGQFSAADLALETVLTHFMKHSDGNFKDDHSLLVLRTSE